MSSFDVVAGAEVGAENMSNGSDGGGAFASSSPDDELSSSLSSESDADDASADDSSLSSESEPSDDDASLSDESTASTQEGDHSRASVIDIMSRLVKSCFAHRCNLGWFEPSVLRRLNPQPWIESN